MPRQRRRREPEPAPVNPALEVLLDRREKLEEQLSELDEEQMWTVLRLVTENRDKILEYSKSFLLGAAFTEDDLTLGVHSCESPIGICVYDDTNDPNHDHCLFCGDPRERK
jgi:hypothetical protein